MKLPCIHSHHSSKPELHSPNSPKHKSSPGAHTWRSQPKSCSKESLAQCPRNMKPGYTSGVQHFAPLRSQAPEPASFKPSGIRKQQQDKAHKMSRGKKGDNRPESAACPSGFGNCARSSEKGHKWQMLVIVLFVVQGRSQNPNQNSPHTVTVMAL